MNNHRASGKKIESKESANYSTSLGGGKTGLREKEIVKARKEESKEHGRLSAFYIGLGWGPDIWGGANRSADPAFKTRH